MTEDKEKNESKERNNPGSVESKSKSKLEKKTSESKNKKEKGKSEDSVATEEAEKYPIEKKKELLEYYSKEELAEEFRKVKKELVEGRDQVEELQKAVKELQEEVKNWKNKYMRLQADFENAQKRWVKSRQELRSQNTANVIKDFLPLYDSFQKALEEKNEKNQKEIEFLRQFYNQFLNLCKSYNAKPMETKKGHSFDYNLHEAVTTIEREDLAPNTIVDVIQEGWKINKDVLRYAKVVLSRKPKPPEPKEEKEEEKKETEETKEEEQENKKDSKEETVNNDETKETQDNE
ncbi:MAG: hypothetical protein BAJALOKI2v1_460004 [Promethearchaeota archaeon]|nr:MAG: hypothetical protein BAJALOKI2v1_460004 [Candidatus Lokiarchaeota archaeon]